jgi:exodeoxyribonuclease VII small subunit
MTKAEKSPTSLEAALADIETILRQLESGEGTLEANLAAYERGIHLLKFSYGQLSQAEVRIRQLTRIDEQGRPVFETFEHQASIETATKPTRARSKRNEADDAP